MPNFKIIQDIADQARVKIYGSQNAALNTDASGNLSITPPTNGLLITSTALSITPPTNGLSITSTGLSITPPTNGLSITSTGLSITPPTDGLSITSTGLSITPPTNGLSITSTGLSITPPTDGLSITSTGLAITPPTSGLTVTAAAEGLSITPPTNGLLITSTGLSVVSTLATSDVSYSRENITNIAGTGDTTYTVLGLYDWTFGLVNNSLVSSAQTTSQLQISPDGTTWINEGAVVTLSPSTAGALITSTLLKYARVYYAAASASSAVTLSIYFQGQTS